MALLSRRTALLLLVVIVLASFAVRYPLVEHERNQTDSYYIHILSESILANDHAKWTYHPLSYFGYYPFSYPSGNSFLIAEISDLTGLTLETSILAFDMALALLLCLAVFMLSRQFIKQTSVVLLATFFTVMGARFVDTSYWDASARATIVVLVLLGTATLFRASLTSQRALIPIALLFVLGSFATHHMAVLILLFGAGYLVATVQSGYIFRRIRRHKLAWAASINSLVGLSLIMVTFGATGLLGDATYTSFEKTSLFDIDPPFLSVILNLAASYVSQIGFIFVFALLGIPHVLRRSRLNTEVLFLVAILLVFIPVLGNSLYVSMLLSPFVAILGTIWISSLLGRKRVMKIGVVLVGFLIASSIFLPLWSSDRWNEREYMSGDLVEVDSRVFNDCAYLRVYYDDECAISNVNVMAQQLAAISGIDVLASGVQVAINGDVLEQDVRENLTWSSHQFPYNLYRWYEYRDEPNVDFYVLAFMADGSRTISLASSESPLGNYFAKHPKLLVAIDNDQRHRFISMYSNINARLPAELENARYLLQYSGVSRVMELDSYKIYCSEKVSLYALQMPEAVGPYG